MNEKEFIMNEKEEFIYVLYQKFDNLIVLLYVSEDEAKVERLCRYLSQLNYPFEYVRQRKMAMDGLFQDCVDYEEALKKKIDDMRP